MFRKERIVLLEALLMKTKNAGNDCTLRARRNERFPPLHWKRENSLFSLSV